MSRVVLALSLICTWAIAFGPIGVRSLQAEQKREYVSKAEKKKLVETSLHGVPGKKVHIVYFKGPPGFVGGKHYHPGPVFVYVLKGYLTIDEAGKPRQTFGAGQVYVEPVGSTMQARNLSMNEATEILVFQVSGEGEPLMYKAK